MAAGSFGDGINDGGAEMTAQAIRILYRLGLISAQSGKYRLTTNGQRLAYLAEKNRALAMRWRDDGTRVSADQPKQEAPLEP